MSAGLQPLWIGAGGERRFAVLHHPSTAPRAALLFVPPFAEEMNKSRALVARTARALAGIGVAVLVLDLHGCGDSPDDLPQATWDGWCADIERGHRWLADRFGLAPGLWALRGGALVACAALPRLGSVPWLLLWHPASSGKAQLTQFLRLKVAADALAGGEARATTQALMAQLAAGECVEVAGYALPPALALPMAATELAALPPTAGRIDWIEVGGGPGVSPAAQRTVDAWQQSGAVVQARAVAGTPFWQAQEIEDCPALLAATLELAG